ncbi:hypothetical protein J6590_073756 [Homalodisca vitripennis]|nr:hypothetical protein J6590_073756 [Homalodisca vitripennis]
MDTDDTSVSDAITLERYVLSSSSERRDRKTLIVSDKGRVARASSTTDPCQINRENRQRKEGRITHISDSLGDEREPPELTLSPITPKISDLRNSRSPPPRHIISHLLSDGPLGISRFCWIPGWNAGQLPSTSLVFCRAYLSTYTTVVQYEYLDLRTPPCAECPMGIVGKKRRFSRTSSCDRSLFIYHTRPYSLAFSFILFNMFTRLDLPSASPGRGYCTITYAVLWVKAIRGTNCNKITTRAARNLYIHLDPSHFRSWVNYKSTTLSSNPSNICLVLFNLLCWSFLYRSSWTITSQCVAITVQADIRQLMRMSQPIAKVYIISEELSGSKEQGQSKQMISKLNALSPAIIRSGKRWGTFTRDAAATQITWQAGRNLIPYAVRESIIQHGEQIVNGGRTRTLSDRGPVAGETKDGNSGLQVGLTVSLFENGVIYKKGLFLGYAPVNLQCSFDLTTRYATCYKLIFNRTVLRSGQFYKHTKARRRLRPARPSPARAGRSGRSIKGRAGPGWAGPVAIGAVLNTTLTTVKNSYEYYNNVYKRLLVAYPDLELDSRKNKEAEKKSNVTSDHKICEMERLLH